MSEGGATVPRMQTSDAIVPVPRMLGWFDVAARVTFTTLDGSRTRTVHGAYLDAHDQDGPVFLGDGIEMLFFELERDLPAGDDLLAFCDAVTAGLAEANVTTVRCGDAEYRFELTRWEGAPGSPLAD